MLGLDVADDGLDGGPASHLAADGLGDPAHLARDPDPELVRVVVAAVALVDVDAPNLDAGQLLHLGDNGAEGVAVVGIAVQRLGVEHELATLGLGHGCGDRDLAAEFVGRPGLAFADALDLGGVQAVELPAALALLLMAHLIGPGRAGWRRSGSAPDRPWSCAGCRGLSRPRRVRRNLSSRLWRLNCLA